MGLEGEIVGSIPMCQALKNSHNFKGADLDIHVLIYFSAFLKSQMLVSCEEEKNYFSFVAGIREEIVYEEK